MASVGKYAPFPPAAQVRQPNARFVLRYFLYRLSP